MFKMSTLTPKRKLEVKTVETKCATLEELESGASNKDVALTYKVPPNTVSTSRKNKDKLFAALEH